MGWSHRMEAGNVMGRITNACLRQSGGQNGYTHGGTKYFWEVNAVTHKDGSITGSVYNHKTVRKVGVFKISGDGTKVTGPAHFVALSGVQEKKVKKERFTLQKFRYGGFHGDTARRGEIVYVDMADRHPDPLKKMTWGYDSSGSVVAGDYNGFFEKIGRPQTFEFEQTGKYAMDEKRVRHEAIIRAIKRGW